MEGKWAFLTLRSSSLPVKDESFGSFCFLMGIFLQIKKKEAILELRMDLPRVAQVFLQESWALGAGCDALKASLRERRFPAPASFGPWAGWLCGLCSQYALLTIC